MTGTEPKWVQEPALRPATFKYYIHDTAAGYSLEMLGAFTEQALPELSCCWQTAKSTLGNRTLTLDLRGLISADDSARRWLASMTQQGAKCVPESFLRDAVADERHQVETEVPKPGFFVRLLRGFA